VILNDSLSFLTALDGMRKIHNPKVVRKMNQIHREKEHLILMWVPGHAGIQGNEKTDQHARRDQVIILRLRMGYTRLTHGYRVGLNPSPECGDCGARLTVDHLLWDCPTFRRQRIVCNISKETLSGDEDEIRRLISYVQKFGVYHEI
jgi:hypothetical protein